MKTNFEIAVFEGDGIGPEITVPTVSILRQMAAYRAALKQIYPNRLIYTAILWTYHAKLMPLEDALLDSAYDRLDVGEVGS